MRQGKKPVACPWFLPEVTQVGYSLRKTERETGLGQREGLMIVCGGWGVLSSILDI